MAETTSCPADTTSSPAVEDSPPPADRSSTNDCNDVQADSSVINGGNEQKKGTNSDQEEVVEVNLGNQDSKGEDPGNQASEQEHPACNGPSLLEAKIIRQIEYYFGDRNLPKDKFLQQAVATGVDNYVPISTLLTFNRLKALSSSEEVIAAAMRKSKANIVQLSEDGTNIRRHPNNPIPDIFAPEVRKLIKGKSVYAKGFNEVVDLDQLQTFFESFGKVEHIQMRYVGADGDRKFKGSVFVEFVEKESADKFLTKEIVKHEDCELFKESKEDYFKRKNDERKKKKGGINSESVGDDDDEKEKEVISLVKKKGCVLHFKGCGEKPTWEAMKDAMSEYASVAFVDFSDDRTEGYVRFKDEGGAEKAMEGMMAGLTGDQKPQMLGADTELNVLSGTDEEEYWGKMEESKSHRRKPMLRGGRSSWSGGRKRKQKYNSDENLSAAKQPKTSED